MLLQYGATSTAWFPEPFSKFNTPEFQQSDSLMENTVFFSSPVYTCLCPLEVLDQTTEHEAVLCHVQGLFAAGRCMFQLSYMLPWPSTEGEWLSYVHNHRLSTAVFSSCPDECLLEACFYVHVAMITSWPLPGLLHSTSTSFLWYYKMGNIKVIKIQCYPCRCCPVVRVHA